MNKEITYSENILEGFKYLLDNYEDVFVLGQGLWSPWYVGNSMKDLDKIYFQMHPNHVQKIFLIDFPNHHMHYKVWNI